MITEHYKQYQRCDGYHSSADYIGCRKYTYASCLEYTNNNGIIVKMPSHAATPLNIGDPAINTIHNETDNSYQPEHFDQKLFSEEDLFENSLLHYRKWWGENKADIFVNGNRFTGIPIITDKNTLRVDNDSHSYSIPIKKIECIRTADGLSCSCTKHFNKDDPDNLNITR